MSKLRIRCFGRANAAAGSRDVRLGGGVATVRTAQRARAVDTMHLSIAPNPWRSPMHRWLDHLRRLARGGPVVMVTVIATEGSTPRDAGARMLVSASDFAGTIGGGQLEFAETAHARSLLARSTSLGRWHRETRRVILGPDAGQCCGGVVEVLHEVMGALEMQAIEQLAARTGANLITRPLTSGTAMTGMAARDQDDRHHWTEPVSPSATRLYLYGAGHTAREIIGLAAGFPIGLVWIDIAADRFPTLASPQVERIITERPADTAAAAPPGTLHLVMTHSHDLDYAICEGLLRRADFGFLGLIGSATKRARFVQRLRRAGIADATLARLTCPIGIPAIPGKAPAVVALSALAQLVALVPALRD